MKVANNDIVPIGMESMLWGKKSSNTLVNPQQACAEGAVFLR